MDLEKIKTIVNNEMLSNEMKIDSILLVIASDEKAIPTVMSLLEKERKVRKELILDMNLELSRTHLYVEAVEVKKEPDIGDVNRAFILDKIAEFYVKYRGLVTHCFNRFK